jgi:hypothetical protein
MPVRDSKRALAEVAAMLGTDTAQARTYLRTVQHLVGPVPYHRIVEAMRRAEGHDPHKVAELIRQDRAADQPDTARGRLTNADD